MTNPSKTPKPLSLLERPARSAAWPVAVMYVAAGALAILNSFAPWGQAASPRMLLGLGLADIAVGLTVLALPWWRWDRRALLLLVPMTLVLIQAFAAIGGLNHGTYPIFFVVLHIWLGLAHPPGTALWLSPMVAAAYLAPLVTNASVGDVATTVGLTLPVCIVVAEVTSRANRSAQEAERRAIDSRHASAMEHRTNQRDEATSRLTAVCSQLPGVVWTTDKDLVLTWVSGNLLAELLDPSLLVGRDIAQLYGSGDTTFPPMKAHLEALDGKDGDFEIDFVDSRLLRCLVTPLVDTEGQVIGTVGVGFDVTEERRLATQLHQAQKLEAVGQIAGGVAHDFNNLLSVVRNFTQFVVDDLDEDDERVADLKEVTKAADRAAGLVRQLLLFSRQEVVKPTVVDVNEVIENLTKMLRRTLPENVELTTNLDDEAWKIWTDPAQIEQILLNLAINARDAMPTGGTLRLSTMNLTKASDSGDGTEFVVITVSDSGTGIKKSDISRIFDPFFTTKERGKGTGLGLATVYGIVQEAGGSIEVDSAVGRGTTFTIRLPRCSKAAVEDLETLTEIARGSGETILVAEDESAVLSVVVRILEKGGYNVLGHDDPRAALAAWSEHPHEIDLLVTDVLMPSLMGEQLSRATGLKTLFMTGYADLASVDDLLSGEALVMKPFSKDQLLSAVHSALGNALPVAEPPELQVTR